MSPLLEARGLVVSYETPRGPVRALDGVDLALAPGETLGVVGESGSGKTTLGLAVGRLLPAEARREAGELTVAGVPVFDSAPETLRILRRRALGFVFQNPMAALDPTMRVGHQVARALGGRPRFTHVAALLGRAGLAEPERVALSFPHQLSGGMAQRVVIAMAIARNPALVVADEPTASLDASIRERVMQTLMELRTASGASLIVLSHDLRTVARHCDRVAVMYGGRIVELGDSAGVFARPSHPYTRALLGAAAGNEGPDGLLSPIPGAPPVLQGPCPCCAYEPRCARRRPRCARERPVRRALDGRESACHYAEQVLAEAAP
jgi:oligopeptide/dipeptide ABC transporter ATP-binding protein